MNYLDFLSNTKINWALLSSLIIEVGYWYSKIPKSFWRYWILLLESTCSHVTFFTPSNVHAHPTYVWACALDTHPFLGCVCVCEWIFVFLPDFFGFLPIFVCNFFLIFFSFLTDFLDFFLKNLDLFLKFSVFLPKNFWIS